MPSGLARLVLAALTTTDKSATAGAEAVRERLPWLIGAGGLLLFLVTLNPWISLPGLGTVARTAGWLWQPEVGRPLSFALFLPFRLLPVAWLPLALNLFTATLAGLVLVQLARSVMLLRYHVASGDPMHQGKPVFVRLSSRAAWMPPVLAALVCGLQLTFWENATAATGEMISLWCFSHAIRCLLEFQASDKPSWLYRCVAVYAAGMADNWLLVGYAPVLLATLIGVKGLGPFLQPAFLLRLVGWGLVGLSFYLLVPALLSLSPDQPTGFGAALTAHLNAQKQILVACRNPALRLLVLTAMLPALLFAVRWRSHTVQFADDTPLGIFLIKATGHGVHALFFLTALWIALNPGFTWRREDLGLTLLAYYYLWAVVAGYGAGYFLLLKTGRPSPRPARWPAYGLAVVIGVMPLLLLGKNFVELRCANSSALRDFARELVNDLPAGQSVVLSEDPRQLLLLRAELAARGRENVLLIETPALISPRYRQFLTRTHPARWPSASSTNRNETIGPAQLLEPISKLTTGEPVVYLHPSSGFFLERFTDEPRGSIHRLVPRASVEASAPELTASTVATNEQIWQQRWNDHLAPLAKQFAQVRQNADHWTRPPFKQFRLARRSNPTVAFLGAAYSKSLDYWGVQARRAGHEPQAMEWFRRALELNPDNLSAAINLEYATRCEQGDRSRLRLAWAREHFKETLGQHDRWWEVMSQNGPVDEPTFLLISGQTWLTARLPRQAADAFARSMALAPDWLAPKLWLAQSCNVARDYAATLNLTDGIDVARTGLQAPGLAQLLLCRSLALRGLGRTNEAAAYIEQFVASHGTNAPVLNAAATLHAVEARFDRELECRELLLQQEPNNPELLLKKGLAELRLERYEPAIVTLTKALTLSPGDSNARLLRAVAHLRAGQLEASKSDYRALLNQPKTSQHALFELGGIAWQEHDTNAVIRYYQQFLSNSAATTPQFNVAAERLRQLGED